MLKRELEIVVISDVHLGTYGCHAQELLHYLNSVHPKILILNGDIIDTWQYKKNSLSIDHQAIVAYILKLAESGCKVYYLSGNHDDITRGYSPMANENIILRNHLELVIDRKRYWIFHGDIFDASVTISPFIAEIGLRSYRYLIWLNSLIDRIRVRLGMSRLSLAQNVKTRVKKALRYIADFENIVCSHALKKNYDVVICGHIHVPAIKKMHEGQVTYMNAGDWVENLTSLEYQHQIWSIYHYDTADFIPVSKRLQVSKRLLKHSG